MNDIQTVSGFDAFLKEWLSEIVEGQPSTSELGRRFASKIVTQWLDEAEVGPDLIFCDGAGDGGIDVAYLDRGDDEPETPAGDTWYLVQSKHGSAFRGTSTLIDEAQKVIDALDGKRQRLSSLAEGLFERLQTFRRAASDRDRIVLVFATERKLTEIEMRALNDIRAMGSSRLGTAFGVEAVSVETIYERLLDEEAEQKRIEVPLKGHFAPSGPDLLVGTVRLPDLYEFLKVYRDTTQDLDQLYEKNVRKFLGGRTKINKAIQNTLRENPERFGLYNNGITIVVANFDTSGLPSNLRLFEPYVVNGCQTTRTIWDVFLARMDAGGRGKDADIEAWRERARQGSVVVKVAKVGSGGEAMLQMITRYTNSQNAVRDKDFLALTGDFRSWQAQLAAQRNIYLEVQRGGWDSQKAVQRQRPAGHHFKRWGNAADLMKVFGAGWFSEAGLAYGKNPPFLPGGAVFRRITEPDGSNALPFGADDLYAAVLLQEAADQLRFGRGSEKPSRRQTRHLF